MSDEIFQAGNPVLVGVEPSSTYVYLMEPSSKRDSVSRWAAYCEKQENQGLNLEESITDGRLGMKKGIREVYENANLKASIAIEKYDIMKILIM